MQDAAGSDEGEGLDREMIGKLARALYAAQSGEPFSKEAWDGKRSDYVKLARKTLRILERQGLRLADS